MAANDFNKEVRVMFDRVLEKFDNTLKASRAAMRVDTNQQMMEHTNDVLWYPQPYVMPTYSGNDATTAFTNGVAQLSVPASINQQQFGAFTLTARQLRDQAQVDRIGSGITQKIANDIDISITTAASLLGTVVVSRSVAATGFDDLALCESVLTERGIGNDDRKMLLNTRDYNNMASDLAKVKTSAAPAALTAYEKAVLPDIAGFDVMKVANAYRLIGAAATGVTVAGGGQFYTPVGSTLTAGRGNLNVDNRFFQLSLTVSAGTIKVGDAFTIAGINAVNHITKVDTGQLKTFRIVSIVSGSGGSGAFLITPPIISGSGGTGPEQQYKNVTSSASNGAAITFLNTTSALVNPFWQGDAMQIFPGVLMPAPDSGMATMTGTTDTGFGLKMTRQGEINTLTTKYRFDAIWGVLVAQPEMVGITMFSQS